jgi:hypothetical protein
MSKPATQRAAGRTHLAADEQVFDDSRVEVVAPARELPGELAERVRPVALARDHTIPVAPGLRPLLPAGLARGTVLGVEARPGATGATSLALMVVAGPSQEGAWVAAAGMPALGLAAAAELGVALERLVVVDATRPRHRQLASVVAALVDGFDVVLVGHAVAARLHGTETRRLVARVRERRAVLVVVGPPRNGGRNGRDPAGSAAVSVRLAVTTSTWEGLDGGAGHLQRRRITVEATGRGAASRPLRAELEVA